MPTATAAVTTPTATTVATSTAQQWQQKLAIEAAAKN